MVIPDGARGEAIELWRRRGTAYLNRAVDTGMRRHHGEQTPESQSQRPLVLNLDLNADRHVIGAAGPITRITQYGLASQAGCQVGCHPDMVQPPSPI
jgi:hypothetical protein